MINSKIKSRLSDILCQATVNIYWTATNKQQTKKKTSLRFEAE